MSRAIKIVGTTMDLLKPDATDKDDRTLLSWASEQGLNGAVARLLEMGAGVDITDTNGHTPFWWAVSNGYGVTAGLLLGSSSVGILMSGVVGIMDTAMDLLKPDVTDKDGRTLLSWASEHGLYEVVAKLLEKGARVDITDNNGHTPFWWAVTSGHSTVAELLLKGSDISTLMSGATEMVDMTMDLLGPDTTDKDGRTLLSWASEHGLYKAVAKLLEKNVKVDVEDNRGRTPLSWAQGRGHGGVVELPVEKGAVMETQNDDEGAVLWWTISMGIFACIIRYV